MAELLKNVYNEQFFEQFTAALQQLLPQFNKSHFLAQIYDAAWEDRELKQRMRHIFTTLHAHLTGNYEKQLNSGFRLLTGLFFYYLTISKVSRAASQRLNRKRIKIAIYD